jgi:hypothetical protein
MTTTASGVLSACLSKRFWRHWSASYSAAVAFHSTRSFRSSDGVSSGRSITFRPGSATAASSRICKCSNIRPALSASNNSALYSRTNRRPSPVSAATSVRSNCAVFCFSGKDSSRRGPVESFAPAAPVANSVRLSS